MKKILYLIFPIFENKFAEQKIKRVIKELEEDSRNKNPDNLFIKEFVKLGNKELEDFFNLSLEGKNILEDKAKGLTLIFTITVSVLLGVGAFIGKNANFIYSGLYMSIGIVVSLYAVFNIIIASILILETLFSLNKVYYLSPEDAMSKAKEKKIAIAFNTVLNNRYNLLRNNNLYTVYRCIMSTFVSLALSFLFLIFSLNFENNEIKRVNSSIGNLRTEMETKIRKAENNQEKIDSLLERLKNLEEDFLKVKKYKSFKN